MSTRHGTAHGSTTQNADAPNADAPNAIARVHLQLSARAQNDMAAVVSRTEMSQSASVCAALRCYRAMLDLGQVAESGELLHAAGKLRKPERRATGSRGGSATSGA